MASRHSHYIVGKPISTKGRLILSLGILLIALVLGFAASSVLYQTNRDLMRQSDVIGYVLCGESQRIDDVPARKGRRMICRDAAGLEVSARNNLIAVNMALPFIVMFAMPGLMVAWMLDFREVRRR
jgi:hypothetical protein